MVDPVSSQHSNWPAFLLAVVGTVVGIAAFLGCVMVVVNRVEWWRGYVAASIAAALATAASLVPLVIGIRRGGALLVQMFQISSAVRGFITIGICALAVGVGRYPSLPTFAVDPLLPRTARDRIVHVVPRAEGRSRRKGELK